MRRQQGPLAISHFGIELRIVLTVAAGAAIGGVMRLCATQWLIARTGAASAPYATLVINVAGSYAIGIVLALAGTRSDFPPLLRYFLATGILGGFTTFSTFSFDALNFARSGQIVSALLYSGASVSLGIGAAFLGVLTARSR